MDTMLRMGVAHAFRANIIRDFHNGTALKHLCVGSNNAKHEH